MELLNTRQTERARECKEVAGLGQVDLEEAHLGLPGECDKDGGLGARLMGREYKGWGMAGYGMEAVVNSESPGKDVGSTVQVLDGEVKVMEAHHPGVGS